MGAIKTYSGVLIINIISSNNILLGNFQNNPKKVNQTRLSFGLKHPTTDLFVIVDTNNPKNIDIDKDGKGDFTHGRLVEKFINITKPLATVKFFQVKKKPPEYREVNDNDLLRGLKEALDFVKTHTVKALNISLGNSLEIDKIKELTGIKLKDNKISQTEREKLEKFYRQVFNATSSQKIPEGRKLTDDEETIVIARVIKLVEDIIAEGVPVYIAAGNDGKNTLNMYNVADGCHAVGSVGQGDSISSFSPEHKFLEYAQGEFWITQLVIDGKIAGYNLTGSHNIEIRPEELSNTNIELKPYYGQNFIGQNIKDYAISQQDFNYLKDFFDGKPVDDDHIEKIPELLEKNLFTVDQLLQLNRKISPQKIKSIQQLGNYISNDMRLIVKSDKNGKITNTCRINSMQMITGTSYASPIKMASSE